MAAARVVITSLIYYPFTAEPYKVIQKYDDTDWSNDLSANGFMSSALPFLLRFLSTWKNYGREEEFPDGKYHWMKEEMGYITIRRQVSKCYI